MKKPTLADIKARIKPPPDRKSKRTPERALTIYMALASGLSRAASAAAAGIDDNTFYRWVASDPGFDTMAREAEGLSEAAYTLKVFEAADAGAWQAAAWWLERRRPSLYGKRDRVDVNLDMRALAESLARAEGLDPDELMNEALHILDVHKEQQRLVGPGE